MQTSDALIFLTCTFLWFAGVVKYFWVYFHWLPWPNFYLTLIRGTVLNQLSRTLIQQDFTKDICWDVQQHDFHLFTTVTKTTLLGHFNEDALRSIFWELLILPFLYIFEDWEDWALVLFVSWLLFGRTLIGWSSSFNRQMASRTISNFQVSVPS